MSSGAETSLAIVRGAIANSQRLTRSLPAHSAYGLPVYVAASQAAPFLDFARMTEGSHCSAAVSDRRI